jgi:hypothetical protein
MGAHSVLVRLSVLAAAAVAAAVPAGCGAASPETAKHTGATAEFRNAFLTFSRPTVWKPFVFRISGTLHFKPMLYLSSQPAHPPCRTKVAETVCGWPVDRLRAGGALIVWENRAAPGWSLDTFPGTSLDIGGRKAKRVASRPGECGAIGADETIEVAIERPLRNNWTAFTACLKGPGLAAGEDRVDALLASTRFLAP